MANKTLDGLNNRGTIAGTDILVVAEVGATNGEATKTTVDGLRDAVAGTSANDLVQLDGSARLPAVDGSQLQNIPGGVANAVTSDAVTVPGAPPDVAAGSVDHIIELTQDQYDALDANSEIDEDTLYIVTGGDVGVTAAKNEADNTLVNRIVSISNDDYTDAGFTPDANTLYVIEDGVTKDSYNGQIDTVAANKTYYLDAAAVTERTVKNILVNATLTGAAGTMTLDLSGSTEATIDFTGASSQSVAISVSVPAGNSIALVTDGSVTGVTDLSFVVEYEV